MSSEHDETKFEKIKQHLKNNRKIYLGAAGSVAFAGITCFVMRERYEALANSGAYGLKTADTSVTMRPLSFLSSQINAVNVINRSIIGRPGYLIRSIDTNEFFASQREAAKAFGISEAVLSKHVTGKLPNANGHLFERLYFAD